MKNLKQIWQAIVFAFDWKTNPASVFWIALPLFFLGVGALGLRAFLELKQNGDVVYALIFGVAMMIFALAMVPVYKWYVLTKRLEGDRHER
jgi:uncharacterized membrane protein (DUF485 family)